MRLYFIQIKFEWCQFWLMDEQSFYESNGAFPIDNYSQVLEMPQMPYSNATAKLPDDDAGVGGAPASMLSHRGAKNELRGYLIKTAQNISKFQRNKFFKRFYELDEKTRQLKVFSQDGGALKDVMDCDIVDVVTCLNYDFRTDYKDFFVKESYQGTSIERPVSYGKPFALFFESGTMQVFFASSDQDYTVWTDAFRSLICTQSNGDAPPPIPEQTDQNYFVATIYLCLLPPEFVSMDLKGVLTDKVTQKQKMLDIASDNHQNDVVVTDQDIRGYLIKTVQDNGVLKKQKLHKRWYVLNANAMTLYIGESPSDTNGKKLEFRTNRLAHVECFVGRKVDELELFQSNSSANKVAFFEGRTEPIGLIFAKGNVMLLWAKRGKEFKYWTRAFKRLVQDDLGQQLPRYKTVNLAQRPENSFVMSVFRGLIPRVELDYAVAEREELKTVEGWLCKTSNNFSIDSDKKAFLKAYCVLDFEKRLLYLCDRTNGEVIESIPINSELRFADTDLCGRIIKSVNHPLADNSMLQNIKLPLAFVHPFALIFADGSLNIFWAQSEQEVNRWKDILAKLVPKPDSPDFVNYITWSKQNQFLPTLYTALGRKNYPLPDKNDQQISMKQFQSNVEFPPNELLLHTDNEPEGEINYRTNRGTKDDMIVGWLSLTQQKQPSWGQEPFLYRFFKLNMLTGILTEHEDQMKNRRLNEFVLLRKIVWIETNLSNELLSDHESIFQRNLQEGPPTGFALPRDNVKPICLHLADGDLILLWASAKREYAKWLEAFQRLQLPLLKEGRQQILIRVTQQNGFTASVFSSIKPASSNTYQNGLSAIPGGETEIKGRCLNTAQSSSGFKANRTLDRFYNFNMPDKKLVLTVQENGGNGKKTHDLSNLSWVDPSLTDAFDEGFQSIFQREGIQISAADGYFQVDREFKYPIVLGMRDGSMMILWLEFEWERNHINEALSVLVKSNWESGCQEHDYIIQAKRNNFVTSLYQSLRRLNNEDDENSLVKGVIGLYKVANSSHVVSSKYIILDKRTRMLRIYSAAHHELEEEHDLRFVVTLQEQSNKDTKQENHFAVHNAAHYFLFRTTNAQDYIKWTSAFELIDELQYHDSELWVDGARNETLFPSNLIELSSIAPNTSLVAAPSNSEESQMHGFLCKTAQTLDKHLSNAQIFYKRHYTVDQASKQVLVSNTAESKVKEFFNLSQLLKVDDGLMMRFCPGHRQHFRKHCLKAQLQKIRPPKDFEYPFCLLFQDGTVQLLWAQSESERAMWTQTLKLYEPQQKRRHSFFLRYPDNFLAVTMYLCLKPQMPAILLETKFEVNQVEEAFDSVTHRQEHIKSIVIVQEGSKQSQKQPTSIKEEQKEIIEAMFSAQGSLEGWLYKTSQKVSFWQSDFFHKRYYKLDLRTQVLKVFSRPEGTLNQKLELNKGIMKVDSQLKQSLTAAELASLGKEIALPQYKFPFAVFTSSDCFVLWAETVEDSLKWVNAFKGIILESDQAMVEQFKPKADAKNKFVFQLYKSLGQGAGTIPNDEQIKEACAQKKQKQSSEIEEQKNNVQDHNDEKSFQVQQQIDQQSKNEIRAEPEDFAATQQINQPQSNQISFIAPQKSQESLKSAGQKENYFNKSLPTMGQERMNIQEQLFDDHAAYRNQNITAMDRKTDHLVEQPQKGKGMAKSITSRNISIQSRPGRKLNVTSGDGGSSRGPIKIKKIIPLKDMTQTDTNRQSVQSISTIDKDNIVSKHNKEESDDDIERDPTAEIIQAPFRRYRKASLNGKKITVKMRGQSSVTSRLPQNEQFVSYQQSDQQNQGLSLMRSSWNRSATGVQQDQANFEDKVKGQVNKDFINSLLNQSSSGIPIKQSSLEGGKSAWSNVARSLRDQIKLKAEAQVLENAKHGQSQSMRLSPALPIKPADAFIRVKPPKVQGPTSSFTVNKTEGEQQLSDWDDEDGDAQSNECIVAKSQRYSNIDHQRKQNKKNILVNVRDHTSGLANVFNSQILKVPANAENASSVKPQQLFRRSWRKKIPSKPAEVPRQQQHEEQPQAPLNQKIDIQTMPNVNDDCNAETYNSVWD